MMQYQLHEQLREKLLVFLKEICRVLYIGTSYSDKNERSACVTLCKLRQDCPEIARAMSRSILRK